MRIALAIINFLALAGAIFWWISEPSHEPAITSVVLFGALLAQIFTSDELKSKVKLIQKNKKGSTNYQAAGDQHNSTQEIIQIGGDGSQLLQATAMTVHLGIDEKRAREIYHEMNIQLRRDYTSEALEIANQRVTEFENILMPKMNSVEGALEAFADPSFQLLLVQAQKKAASSERTADYDLLSELLIHRFKRGWDRKIRAGINRAVDIVDEISDDALLGLTVSHSISCFTPVSGDIEEGLDVLNGLFGKVIYDDLPGGIEWLDHLDILDAVRISTFGGLKKIEQFYTEQLSGYVDVGIEKESENYSKAIGLLDDNRLPKLLLVDHSLNQDYSRLSVVNKDQIKSLKLQRLEMRDGGIVAISEELSEDQIQALYSIYNLYNNDGNLRKQNFDSFMKEWNKREHLLKLKSWWDAITTAFELTSAGKVLAHSNAQRCDKSLPPLN